MRSILLPLLFFTVLGGQAQAATDSTPAAPVASASTSTTVSSPAPAPSTPSTAPTATATLHPALFLVGDSIMKTGTPPGDRGAYGMGYELMPLFDPAKIHVYNEGAGGRSSRGYIEEGLWPKVVERLQPGDFVIVMFGHNDAANSQNYPDRTTLAGNGDDTQEIISPVNGQKETIHSYGWYMRQYAAQAKAKGATIIICSPVPRNTWSDGKIKRGFDGYVQWAAQAATKAGALYVDLNTLAADRFDALGQQPSASYFADNQHSTKAGAKSNAEALIAGLKQIKDLPLVNDLLPPVSTAPPSTPAPAIPVAP